MDISIVIPAYNEAERIGPTLMSIEAYFLKNPCAYEIIVVDDGSKDATVSKVMLSNMKNVKILSNEVNQGKGYSVKRGMLEARGRNRLFMDADGSVSIDHLSLFLKYASEGYALVIGSIAIPGSKIIEENLWYRKLFGSLSKTLIRFVATPGVYDTQRGFKLFSARATEEVFSHQTIMRWGFDIELLVIARKFRSRIKEVPVEWNNPQEGSKVGAMDYVRTLRELGSIVKNNFLGKYNR